jgi:chromosome transmission fidelity protein 4
LEKRQEGLLPIRNGGTITWAGFSEMDVPAVFDNQGLLLLLDRATSSAGQSRWIPALDTKALAVKEGRSEDGPVSRIKYWPVGLDGQNLLAVMLKGQNMPDASSTSRPIIQDLALAMPVAGAGDATAMLEEQLLRQTHLATFARAFRSSLQPEEEEEEFYADLLDQPAARAGTLEHEADKAVLQIIQQSCKSNKHQRVLDAARELHSARTLDAAMQIGTFFHLSTLVDRMNALRGWVSERAERDERMVIGTQPVMYAAATAPADSRILVESSPGPSGAAVDSKQAKRALGRDFESLPSTRHQRGARSELAKVGQSPSSTWAGHNARSSNVEEEENVSQAEDSDAYMAEPNGSPVGAGQKRRSNEIGEEEMLGQTAHNSGATKRARESTVTSPFSNKTNKTFPKPPMASTTTASKNPFARTATAGMTRDKSLHKSNSFFDRVDTANARSAPSGAQKTKQATLFGMTTGVRSSTAAVSPVVVATSVFGDNETQQTMPTNEEPYTEQAMDLSLRAARRRNEESQVQMEETQYAGDEGEEESQDASHNAQAATSIAVS